MRQPAPVPAHLSPVALSMPAPSRVSLVLLPLLAAVLLAGSPANAQRQPERGERGERSADRRGPPAQQARQQRQEPARGRQERRQDSMADSIRHVRRANRGQIIAADRMHYNGRQINRIKLVDERGRVRVIEDDPQRRSRQRSRGDDD